MIEPGARDLGALTIPAGGMDTLRRLEMIREQRATVLLCTPSYALRMLEQAREQGIDLRDMGVLSRRWA